MIAFSHTQRTVTKNGSIEEVIAGHRWVTKNGFFEEAIEVHESRRSQSTPRDWSPRGACVITNSIAEDRMDPLDHVRAAAARRAYPRTCRGAPWEEDNDEVNYMQATNCPDGSFVDLTDLSSSCDPAVNKDAGIRTPYSTASEVAFEDFDLTGPLPFGDFATPDPCSSMFVPMLPTLCLDTMVLAISSAVHADGSSTSSCAHQSNHFHDSGNVAPGAADLDHQALNGIGPPLQSMMTHPDPTMYAMWKYNRLAMHYKQFRPTFPFSEPIQAAVGFQNNVWELAKTADGTWLVQEALEVHFRASSSDWLALDNARQLEIADGMRTHVKEGCQCPHASHVIQKCIIELLPKDGQFILTELNEGPGSAVRIARHKFGYRVLQRLLEHGSPDQVHWIAEQLLPEAVELSKHASANFVLQHVLDWGSAEHQNRLIALLTLHVATVAEGGAHGPAVLQKAMDTNDEAKVELSHALISQPRLLAAMACTDTRHGNLTAQKLLEKAGEASRNQALLELMTYEDKLKTSRYGRVLFRYVEEKLRAAGRHIGSSLSVTA